LPLYSILLTGSRESAVVRDMNKKGFSLTEIMFVVMILFIVSAFGIPNYAKMIERRKESTGKLGLESIFLAQQRHFLEKNTYFYPDLLLPDPVIDQINFNLRLRLTEGNEDTGFLYKIIPASIPNGGPTEYEAYAASRFSKCKMGIISKSGGDVFDETGECRSKL